MAITMYGIPSCDTVKKARAWLAARGAAYTFHDFKRHGVPKALTAWADALGWEPLLNRRGTTWRKLAPETQARVDGAASALALMREQPSVIKRPIVDWGDGSFTVGFDAAGWSERVGSTP